MEEKRRILYLDGLRIFATMAVILLHISAQNWRNAEVTSFSWQVFNFLDSITRCSVPLFVMISGALFLDKKVNIKKIYTKNIFRIFTAFLFWSLVYATVSYIEGMTLKKALIQLVEGYYHMWFLFMIVGLYMVIPLLKKIVEEESLMKYFLILALLFTCLVPQSIRVVSLEYKKIGSIMNVMWGNTFFHFTLGYVGYFVLGYFLSKKKLSKKGRMGIYLASLVGFLSTIILSSMLSIHVKGPNGTFYDFFSLNVLLESVGVFVFFQYALGSKKLSSKVEKGIKHLSKNSFGVYLVHILVLEQLDYLVGWNTLSFSPIVSVLLLFVLVSTVSFFISDLLNRIPKVKKYIV